MFIFFVLTCSRRSLFSGNWTKMWSIVDPFIFAETSSGVIALRISLCSMVSMCENILKWSSLISGFSFEQIFLKQVFFRDQISRFLFTCTFSVISSGRSISLPGRKDFSLTAMPFNSWSICFNEKKVALIFWDSLNICVQPKKISFVCKRGYGERCTGSFTFQTQMRRTKLLLRMAKQKF